MAAFKTLDDPQAAGAARALRVLVRLDLTVPMRDGRVTDQTRIMRAAPTVAELAANGARAVVLSHFGRPGGRAQKDLSHEPLAEALAEALGRPVGFSPDCIGAAAEAAVGALADGGVVLLENLRFHAAEEANDPAFAAALARLGDAYVNDAFSVSHRAHASVDALARSLPAYAGRLMQAELKALARALGSPRHPVAAIVGGAKVSTKLELLGNLVRKVDLLIIGGGMANTFLHADGVEIGTSLAERDLADTARAIRATAEREGCRVLLQSDAVVADRLAPGVEAQTVDIGAVPPDAMIHDAGPASVGAFVQAIEGCRTLVWNGPVGAFETPPFDRGTAALAVAVARLSDAGSLMSVAGGGDTVAALAAAGVVDRLGYVSTAGGAFLEWLEGKTLPGVSALEVG